MPTSRLASGLMALLWVSPRARFSSYNALAPGLAVDSGEGPEVAGVAESLVAGVAGEHDVVFAGCFGDG